MRLLRMPVLQHWLHMPQLLPEFQKTAAQLFLTACCIRVGRMQARMIRCCGVPTAGSSRPVFNKIAACALEWFVQGNRSNLLEQG